MNINVFSFFDYNGRARHPTVISLINYERVANLLYCKKHYVAITSIPCLIKDITKQKQQLNFCLRCLDHFSSEKVLARHMELCNRDDYMSIFHIISTPGSKQAQIKFNKYGYCTNAPFVIYADFESIFEQFKRQE